MVKEMIMIRAVPLRTSRPELKPESRAIPKTEPGIIYGNMVSVSRIPVRSEGFRTVYPMMDRFYHLCVDVFDNASAELGNMNGRQEQFAVGFSGILMHYLMMTAGDQSDLSNLVVRDEEVYRLVHQFMYGIYS